MKSRYSLLLSLTLLIAVPGMALTAHNEQIYQGATPAQLLSYFTDGQKLTALAQYVDNVSGDPKTASVSVEKAEINPEPNGKFAVRFKLPGGYAGEQSGSLVGVFSKINGSVGLILKWTGRHFDPNGNVIMENKDIETTILIAAVPTGEGSLIQINSEGLKTLAGVATISEGWERNYLLPLYGVLRNQPKP